MTKNLYINELFFIIQNHIVITDGKRMLHYKRLESILKKMRIYSNDNNKFYNIVECFLYTNDMVDIDSFIFIIYL